MKLSKQQACELIDQRMDQRIYENYSFGNLWPFGQYKGQDINRLPLGYVIWHLANNEQLSQSHLRFFKQQFENTTHWDYEPWSPPARQAQEHTPGHYAGHYTGACSGYYDGT